jgi:exodeoxyribonuclease III
MKIATFNINNVNKRLANLLDWLEAAAPDAVCLQELKAADAEFPRAAIDRAGYGAVWRGQRSWNGVAILARGATPIVTRTELPGDPADTQSRYIEAAVNGVIIGSLYAPNGNPQPGPKFAYKLAWLARLAAHAAELYAAGVPVVLAGDYNVVPTERDIYPTTSYTTNALVQPESRAALRRILDQGWVDAVRALHPDAPMYTFWDYLRNRWLRDAGLRLDLLLLGADTARRLVAAGVDRDVRGAAGASDHAPAWVVLRDVLSRASAARRSSRRAEREPGPRAISTEPATLGPGSRAQRRAWPGHGKLSPMATPELRPLLVIDGDSFAHRAYHALPKSILGRGGRPAGAILGFANVLIRFYEAEKPRAVLVGWDTLDVPTWRHEKFPAYQGGRQFDDALLEQLDALPQLVAACGFAVAKAEGYEADDFLAAAVAAEERRGGRALVASGDRDTFQLASAATTILYPVRAGEIARIGAAEVRERYGVDPAQVPDFIALRGDPSDKLPGAPGVGPKGAAALLRQYGTLEDALAAGRFAAQADTLRLYRAIATMDASAPLPALADQAPTWAKAAALARDWELAALANRLAGLAEGKA